MTDKELKKLGRGELLDILLEQSKEIDRLKEELAEAEKKVSEAMEKVEERELKINNAGSIAEAALQLSGIFNIAQQAADQYLDNIKSLTARQDEILSREKETVEENINRMLAEANARCEAMETDTIARCDVMKARAKSEADNYWQEVSSKLEDFYSAHQGLKELLNMPEAMGSMK